LAQAKDPGAFKPTAVAQADRDEAAQPDHSQRAEPVQDLKSSPSTGSLAPLLSNNTYVEIDLGGASETIHSNLTLSS